MGNTSFQQFFNINNQVEVRINVTNVCNLHCNFCDHDAHLPFAKNSTKLFRQKPLVAAPQALEQFCEALVGVGEGERHVLQGGEITVLPIRLIVLLIEILYSYGRRVGMRTNGFNIIEIPLVSLNKLEFIYLNAHGNNQIAIDISRKFLEKNFNGETIYEEKFFHRDPTDFINHNQGTVEQGINCDHLMSTLTFFPPLVHPCCNSWALMNALNTHQIAELLIDAGWTSDNPSLKNTLVNWRLTLPKLFLNTYCANSCYKTAPGTDSPWHQIQPHYLDKVLKR